MNRLPGVTWDASPNYSARIDADRVRYSIDGLVIHYTAGMNSIGWMKNPAAKASAHFIVSRDGKVTQLVDLENAAWHAGVSTMPYHGRPTQNANLFTVGIEIENLGLIERTPSGKFMVAVGNGIQPYACAGAPVQGSLHFESGHSVAGWWEPFYEPQLKALEGLLVQLKSLYPNILKNMYGHQEVSQPIGRKIDPGPLFPWERFGRDLATLKVRQTVTPIRVA